MALGQALDWTDEDAQDFWHDLELYESLAANEPRRDSRRGYRLRTFCGPRRAAARSFADGTGSPRRRKISAGAERLRRPRPPRRFLASPRKLIRRTREILRPRLQHDVKRRFRRSPDALESRRVQNLRKPALSRLRAQTQVPPPAKAKPACTASWKLSRTRARWDSDCPRVYRSRTARRSSTFRWERAFPARAAPRLRDRPCRAGNRRTPRNHSPSPDNPSPRHFELHAIGNAGFGRGLSRQFDRPRDGNRNPTNVDFGYACAIKIVDVPNPQPTSATRAPALSFASVSPSAGIHSSIKCAR